MQEIQPLTYQKTTNIEEHRQFLQKINEIIDNLAPTVDAAEAAVAEAARALADAVAAIATANAAVDAAEAASQGATQAAATVAGYDSRLSTVEQNYIKKISSVPQVIDSDLQIVNGHSLSVADGIDVSGDLNVAGQAEIAGMAIEQSGGKTILSNANGIRIGDPVLVPDTVTGTRSDEAVNGTRLLNDLDNYAPMLRTTGDQISTGLKMGVFRGYLMDTFPIGVTAKGKWLKYADISTGYTMNIIELWGTRGNNGYCYSRAITGGVGTYTRIAVIDNVKVTGNENEVYMAINTTTNRMEIWIHAMSDTDVKAYRFFNSNSDKNPVYYNEEYDERPSEGYATWVKIS